MALEGGMANQYILDLRKAAMRGIKSKIEQGHAPILAPVGYLNNKTKPQGARDIISHPQYFPIMRKLFELYLSGNYSVEGLARKADELGVRNNLGKNISKSRMYEILRSPFYTGKFVYNGEIHEGKHQPIITDAEFDLIQELLSDKSKPRPKKALEFSLSGFVKCGTCGMSIVGERHLKTYKNGKTQEFRYYRCTKKNKKVRCSEPYAKTKVLENYVKNYLETLEIDPDYSKWVAFWCNYLTDQERGVRDSHKKAIQKAYNKAVSDIDKLVDLKIAEKISDDIYDRKMTIFKEERNKTKNRLKNLDDRSDEWNDLTVNTFRFASRAREKFEKGDLETQQYILRGIGSNLILSNRELSIQPRIPFLKIKKFLETNSAFAKRLEPNKKAVIMGKEDFFNPQFSNLRE